MKTLWRFLTIAALSLIPTLAAIESGIEHLFREFQDPPRKYSVRPFWFWNGKLDSREVERQIEQMMSQGVYGAYVHNRNGLETPYLSEEYFSVVKAGFDKARKLGFLFGFVDEYEWPSGEARDIWQRGLPSRVIASNPEFRMRSLGYMEQDIRGPSRAEFTAVSQFQFALAVPILGDNSLDIESSRDISTGNDEKGFHWSVPSGHWRVMVFYLHPSQGRDGGLVDLLNPASVRKFLDLNYEEYYKRVGAHFGTTMDSTYVDHEGDYGYRIAWTPALYETFQRMKGYDLRKSIPLLMYDGGKRTPKVRCDYLDVISELYSQSFFKQVTDWCEAHKVKITGHVWEETLQMEGAFDGDLQRIMRGWSWPGVDSLWDKGRLPRDFKVAGSVAHFRGTRFTCENQGLQGADSFLDFQKMRLGTNMIAAWGANSFIPHAFNYNRRRIEYPPDWFYHEPYWKYFRHYADYARRLSFMNDGGRHVADILLFQPTESAWAHSEPAFSNKTGYIPSKYNNALEVINTYYTDIMNRMAQERWDYDVADSYFLRIAKIKDRRLEIGNESFGVLILPPVTTMRRETLQKIQSFYEQGGTVIAIHTLPAASMDEGRDDPVIAETVRRIFGSATPVESRANTNAAGGKAFFIKERLEDIVRLIEDNLRQDVKVLNGPRNNFFYLHRRKEEVDFYWLVNDSAEKRDYTVLLSAPGIAEKWDASNASRESIYCTKAEGGTEVRLHFDPWEAYYVVMRRPGEPPTSKIIRTNLQNPTLIPSGPDEFRVTGLAPLSDKNGIFVELGVPDGRRYRGALPVSTPLAAIALDAGWQFQALGSEPDGRGLEVGSDARAEGGSFKIPVIPYPIPYAEVKEDPRGEGTQLGWHRKEFKAVDWKRMWLSRERLTVREWEVIGPFPNEDHRGFMEAYPPEKAVDLKAVYTGSGGIEITWKKWTAQTHGVDLDQALGTPRSKNWVTAYALTYVFSPIARSAQFRVVADNSAKLWVNGRNLLDLHIHPFYFEMREDFALTRATDLRPGWNEVLLKISKCSGARQWAFMLRVTDETGKNFDDLIFSPKRIQARPASTGEMSGPRAQIWYRIIAPPGAIGVQLPPSGKQLKVLWNGQRIWLDEQGEYYRFPFRADGKSDVVLLIGSPEEAVGDSPRFLLGRHSMNPGSWTVSGLPYYSGSAVYERPFTIPGEYIGKKLLLDCGQVGVVAEVWVNDKPAGVRVWLPYSFDISKLVKTGENRLRIVVTNTMENERAVENHAPKLSKIEPNGLIGPVSIVPYQEVVLRCVPIP